MRSFSHTQQLQFNYKPQTEENSQNGDRFYFNRIFRKKYLIHNRSSISIIIIIIIIEVYWLQSCLWLSLANHPYQPLLLISSLDYSHGLVWFSWVLWYISLCWLFNAKSSLHIYTLNILMITFLNDPEIIFLYTLKWFQESIAI